MNQPIWAGARCIRDVVIDGVKYFLIGVKYNMDESVRRKRHRWIHT